MRCQDCTRPMALNFTDYVCEWCASDLEDLLLYTGFIVLTDERLHSPHYVFENISGAKRWRAANDLDDSALRKVLSPRRFRWRPSKGRLTGLSVANRLYHVVPDHKFDPKMPYVILAPKGFRTRRTARTVSSEDSGDAEKSEHDRMKDFFFGKK